MSVTVMALVFSYNMPNLKTDGGVSVPDSTAKFVLLALADHANDEGEAAYPSITILCKKTSMSRSTVCNALNALRTSGFTTFKGESKHRTSNYSINVSKLQTSSVAGLVQPPNFQKSSHRTGSSSATELAAVQPPNSNHPLTVLKPSLNHPRANFPKSPDWSIAHGEKPEEIPHEIDIALMNIPEPMRAHARAFIEATGIIPHKSEYKKWIKEIVRQKEMCISPRVIMEAAKKMQKDGLSITWPGSMTSIARTLEIKRKHDTDHREYTEAEIEGAKAAAEAARQFRRETAEKLGICLPDM